jgi:hypothetical protein
MAISNAIASAMTALAKSLRGANGIAAVAITYKRAADSLSLSATLGRSDFESLASNDATLRLRTVDFIVTTSAFKFGSTAITPQVNDEIEYAGNSYRVSMMAGNCYRYSDPQKTSIRIHASRI